MDRAIIRAEGLPGAVTFMITEPKRKIAGIRILETLAFSNMGTMRGNTMKTITKALMPL